MKRRRSDALGAPAEAVTRTKRARVVRAARRWLAAHPARARAVRFDVVAIVDAPAVVSGSRARSTGTPERKLFRFRGVPPGELYTGADHRMTDLTGRSLGRYRLDALLGQGGMAEVFRATDTKLARTVAVKVILASHARDPHFLERFLREARTVASLEHPNILPVYDFGEDGGIPFLVMPYLPGGTLRDRLQAGPVPLALAAAWIAQLADALDAAHAAVVLHRDVKPANVLLGKDDRLFLADFGIAKMLESESGLTATGVVVGTPIYMAPEQAQGQPASPATDRYALAVVAYEILAGRPPFEGENALSLMHQHVTTPPPALSSRVGGLPAGLDAVLRARPREGSRRAPADVPRVRGRDRGLSSGRGDAGDGRRALGGGADGLDGADRPPVAGRDADAGRPRNRPVAPSSDDARGLARPPRRDAVTLAHERRDGSHVRPQAAAVARVGRRDRGCRVRRSLDRGEGQERRRAGGCRCRRRHRPPRQPSRRPHRRPR